MAGSIQYHEFDNRRQWRAWLAEHHATEKLVWLILYKKKYHDMKYHDPGLTLDKAVEEALCFGWIDGVLDPLDERRYALRFSPRTQNSVWSVKNIQRVEKLIAEGKMTKAGMQKIEEAQQNGQWEAAIRREQVDIIPKDLEDALREIEGALSAYQVLTASRKKQYIYWLQSAKRAETRQRRIQRILKEILE